MATLDLQYQRLHRMVFKARGRAGRHPCFDVNDQGCKNMARDWAQIHNTDGTEPIHYIPLCRRCHATGYDGNLRTSEVNNARVKGKDVKGQGR